MIVPTNVELFISREAADFRKQCDGLSGLVRNQLGKDPADTSLYVFFNRRRDQVKVLYYQAGGFCLWWKRLESGRFADVAVGEEKTYTTITHTQLLMLIDGISLVQRSQQKRHKMRA